MTPSAQSISVGRKVWNVVISMTSELKLTQLPTCTLVKTLFVTAYHKHLSQTCSEQCFVYVPDLSSGMNFVLSYSDKYYWT